MTDGLLEEAAGALEQGELEHAQQLVERYLEAFPNDPLALNLRDEVHYHLRRVGRPPETQRKVGGQLPNTCQLDLEGRAVPKALVEGGGAQADAAEPSPPAGVALLGLYYGAAVVLAAVGAFFSLLGGAPGLILFPFFGFAGIAAWWLSKGLFNLRRTTFLAVLGLNSLGAVVGLFSLGTTGVQGILWVTFNLLIVIYLLRVRHVFEA